LRVRRRLRIISCGCGLPRVASAPVRVVGVRCVPAWESPRGEVPSRASPSSRDSLYEPPAVGGQPGRPRAVEDDRTRRGRIPLLRRYRSPRLIAVEE
jgi:hypothetical protein